MRLHNLKPRPGAKHRTKRLGCGESSGHGKTCGRGHKGQKARSGGTIRPSFEGGQMPLFRRLPKRGFSNYRFQKEIAIVNLDDLERCFETGATINEAALREAGLVRGQFDAIKLLGRGNVTKKFSVHVHFASGSAKQKLEQAGGELVLIPIPPPPGKRNQKKEG
ncbi:MAG: 50S ribosomal protein L15 [Chthoniobacterales bacterium]|nr:50S ribosomal protein L15 [Chthoniobacterales bacterium]MCX7712577.1 50S ribosomal protein L15 [Chthoniobacterales bacterium]